ncbi:primosomal protein N' [Clostridium sp. ATCC 25772]|uniref:primosomal protein N' n=1 Tax=Clostridium sp. ATCC 25772 TaxID=1676991 RepID=UPI0007850C63|nr:primosomal protein N' [Clostridium sp. ATCC 25772]
MKDYVGIIVNNEAVKLDKIFTYKVPDNLKNDMLIGHRVKVPFGFGNKFIDGFVISFYKENDIDKKNIKKIKCVKSICDELPLLKHTDIKLIEIMRRKYLCTYLEAIKVIIPTSITKGIKFKTKLVVMVSKPLEKKYLKENYINIYEFIKVNNGIYSKSELSKENGFSLSSINTLIKYDFLKCEESIVDRYNVKEYKKYEKKVLNKDQKNAVDNILNSSKKQFLIHGVTGSGKTEIYMNLVEGMMNNGKDSIILIPEISLTPQMVERFKGRFGKDVAIFHSKLNDGERFDEWMRVKMGKVKLAIGARSALFLPFENLGLIVIDEEHEASYKSESDPKYVSREIGEIKTQLEYCKLVLGSATPSIETYYKGLIGEYDIITLNNRAANNKLPEIFVSDMREELANGNRSIFSNELYKSIEEALSKDEQIILFLNRRGYSTFVSCRSCGYVFKCDRCDISLTYHNNQSSLNCHYCGNKVQKPKICPKCGSKYVKHFGIGTEQLENQVNKMFPNAKTIRMDFDTTREKNSYEVLYNKFKNKGANVLIGTQMIAKGLDFPDVTLVGVIAADLSLNIPDYKSTERTFQLITQVAGRAGRDKKDGKVVVQTYNPDNYSINYAANNDYLSFLKEELQLRKCLNYPPFSKVMSMNFSSEKENFLIDNVQQLGYKLKNLLEKNQEVSILGPCPCGISKIKNYYRWQIIIKGKITEDLAMNIKKFVYEELENVYNDIRTSIDINPNNML